MDLFDKFGEFVVTIPERTDPGGGLGCCLGGLILLPLSPIILIGIVLFFLIKLTAEGITLLSSGQLDKGVSYLLLPTLAVIAWVIVMIKIYAGLIMIFY